mmetsp:Transcript_43996/g.139574  ORF Transcript_43996/g.139574 Transcript_43996/m.139574 type:complete len:201 (-) Transcript_43996:816-1418(-)
MFPSASRGRRGGSAHRCALRGSRRVVLVGATQHGARLALSRHHRCRLSLFPAAHAAPAEPEVGNWVVVPHVLLRHLLGVPLAPLLREERHGRRRHRRRHGRDGSHVDAHPRHRRPLWQRPHAWLRGHRPARIVDLLLAALRHAEWEAAAQGLLLARCRRLCPRFVCDDRGAARYEDGAACTALPCSRHIGHNLGRRMEAW